MLALRPDAARELRPGLSATVAAGVGFLALASTFGDDSGPVLCVFRRCTGGYCPGCGGSRAVLAIVRGDLAAAWTANPWALLVVVQFAVAGVLALVGRLRRYRSLVVPVLVANVVLGLAIWAIRLAQGSIPIPFA